MDQNGHVFGIITKVKIAVDKNTPYAIILNLNPVGTYYSTYSHM